MLVFARYFTSGLVAVGIHFLVMIVLVETQTVPPVTASFTGFCIGSLVNYKLQHRWTFSSSISHRLAFTRYITVTTSMLILNLLILDIAHTQLHIDYKLAQLLATAIVFISNYTINSRFTFR